ncbi:MAG: sulfite exporter TauE/SafE family protein, partial [Betaproteobacteria bacterium]
MMGLAKSGFLSGFGSLAVPLMALTIPVPQAAAIMLPLLFVMDLAGLQQLWRERDRELIRLLLPAGLIGTVVGTVLFGVLSAKTVAAVVGGLTLLFLAQRLLFPPKVNAPPPPKPLGFMLA